MKFTLPIFAAIIALACGCTTINSTTAKKRFVSGIYYSLNISLFSYITQYCSYFHNATLLSHAIHLNQTPALQHNHHIQ